MIIGYSTITSKGQITLPAGIRKKLQLTPGKQVRLALEAGNKVTIEHQPDILSLKGVIKTTQPPLDSKIMRENFANYLANRSHDKALR